MKPSKPVSPSEVSDAELRTAHFLAQQNQQAAKSTALVKQDPLPALDVVKNKDGSDRLVARQKGKFTKTANARVLATQKLVERIMNMADEEGKTQLEKILIAQAKVCEENTEAKNLTGVTKFLEYADEASGSKAAREALAKDINQETPIRTVIINIPEGILPMPEKKPERKQPTWAEVTEIIQNPK